MTLLQGWPWVGVAVALGWLAWAMTGPRRKPADPWWWLSLLWPVYALHQFEEHGIDVFGHRYAFAAALCRTVQQLFSLTECPSDETFLFAVTVGGVWLAGALAWACARRHWLAGLALLGLPLVNGVVHVVATLREQAYNPGVVSAVLLLVPFSLITLWQFRRAGLLPRRAMPVVVGAGVLIHAVLMGCLWLQSRDWLSRTVVDLVQVLNGAVPLLLGRALLRHEAPVKSQHVTTGSP